MEFVGAVKKEPEASARYEEGAAAATVVVGAAAAAAASSEPEQLKVVRGAKTSSKKVRPKGVKLEGASGWWFVGPFVIWCHYSSAD